MTRPQNLPNVSQQQLIQGGRKQHEAELAEQLGYQPNSTLRVDLPLNVAQDRANPYVVNFPFDGFWVINTVNDDDEVNLGFGVNKNYVDLNPTPLRRNLAVKLDSLALQGRLWWDAQGTGFMSVLFYQGVRVTPGSVLTQVSGQVRLQLPNRSDDARLGATSAAEIVTTTGTTPVQLCAANPNRAAFNFTNDVEIRVVSAPGVAATARGTLIPAGQGFKWENEGECWCYATGADGDVTGLEEEFV